MPPSQDAILQQARTAFRAVAGNLTSTLNDVESLRTAICVTGRNPSIKQCEDAWETAKAGDDVDFTEFCEIISELPRPNKKDLIAAFQALDTNGDGSLDIEEFTKLLCTQGSEKMAKQEVSTIFRQADANEDGRLDYEEFVGMMMSTIQNCDKLEVESKVPQKMVKSIEIESPEISPRSSLYPGNGVKTSNASKPPRNGRKSRNTEIFSDYDTELVFSDLDQAPQNPNDEALMLTNLTSQNSTLNNSTLNSTNAKKQGFFSSIFNKSNPDLSKNPLTTQKIPLPYDLVQIRQAAFTQKSVQKMPSKSPWMRQQLFNTLIMPSFNGLAQTIPLCIVAPSTTEIAISVTSSSAQNLQKLTGLLLSDQNPAAPFQEPIAFTFQKTADPAKFMLKTDIRAGTYKFLVFSTDFKKPVISRDASLIGNGKFLSNQAKAALVEVFKMFDLDGDGFLNRQEYGIFHRITCDDQVLKNEEWNDIVSKVVVNKNRITRDAFLALHQGYLQQDPQIVLESLIECGVDADTLKLNSQKCQISVTSLNNPVQIDYYKDELLNIYDRDLATAFDNFELKRPLANLPAEICSGSEFIRLSVVAAQSDVVVLVKNLNKRKQAKIGVNIGGSRNIKWKSVCDQTAPEKCRILGIAKVLDEGAAMDFVLSLSSCATIVV